MNTRVLTFTETINTDTQSWKLPFNLVIFLNYDLLGEVTINTDIVIPQAQLNSAGSPVPSFFKHALNAGEVNDSNFVFTFGGSTTAKLVIVHTEYKEGV